MGDERCKMDEGNKNISSSAHPFLFLKCFCQTNIKTALAFFVRKFFA